MCRVIHAASYPSRLDFPHTSFLSDQATVLDRLNPLLEEGGLLLVNECGLVDGQPRIITPHPDFRVFMAMDPQFGEVSRAMRNRCVEIVITEVSTPFMDRNV
jgi:midasin